MVNSHRHRGAKRYAQVHAGESVTRPKHASESSDFKSRALPFSGLPPRPEKVRNDETTASCPEEEIQASVWWKTGRGLGTKPAWMTVGHEKLDKSSGGRCLETFSFNGCAEVQSQLHGPFSSCRQWGLLTGCSVRTSHCRGFSCSAAQALRGADTSCGTWAPAVADPRL